MAGTAPQAPRSVKKQTEKVLQVPEQGFTAAHREAHGKAAVPLQPMEVCGAAGGCPKQAVTPWEAHAGRGSWQDLWPPGEEPTLEPVCWQHL